MIEEVNAGWATVKIGEFETKASYLEDLPINWLKSFIFGLRNDVPITLFIEEEGSESYIVTCSNITYIIADGRETRDTYEFDITIEELAKEFLKDLSVYFEEWVNWNPFEEGRPDYGRRNLIKNMMDELKKVLFSDDGEIPIK